MTSLTDCGWITAERADLLLLKGAVNVPEFQR